MPSPTAAVIELTADELEPLEALALRARIVLVAAERLSNTEISARLSVALSTVRKWRNRSAPERLDGLLDEPRPGQPRKITADG